MMRVYVIKALSEGRFALSGLRARNPAGMVFMVINIFVAVLLSSVALAGEGRDFRGYDGKPASSRGTMTISPGEFELSVTPDGKWKSLVPSWTSGRSMIAGGGFILFGKSGGGGEVFSVDPAKGTAATGDYFQAKYFEGCMGGRRKPAPAPDDDGDGLIDEDRPDGEDNDGDGFVDEDFAAIGDEMVVIQNLATSADSNLKLLFHEEIYAWSLTNIDRVAFLSLKVKNVSDENVTLTGLGAYYVLPGSAFLSERSIESSVSPSMKGTVITARDANGILGMMFFTRRGTKLRSGWSEDGEGLLSMIRKDAREERTFGGSSIEDMSGGTVMAADGALVFGLAEAGGALKPGEEIGIDMALLCARSADEMESEIVEAFKTFIGDGENRLVPPPVAIERRVLWGVYKVIREPVEKVLISVERAQSVGFSIDELSFLSYMPLARVKNVESFGPQVNFMYHGDLPKEAVDGTGRLSLKGKLKDGTIFELLLRPQGPAGPGKGKSTLRSFDRAIEYFKTGGQLPEELLSSSPNPFRESTTIYYEVPQRIQDGDESIYNDEGALRTQVKVYNVNGRLVSILADELLGPGVYGTQWNAVDDSGNPLASGIYYVKLQIEKRHVTKRLTYLK